MPRALLLVLASCNPVAPPDRPAEFSWAMTRNAVPMLYHVAASNPERSSVGIVEAERLRAGVYVHAERRFVPLGPWVSGATSALIDPERKRALVLKLRIEDCRADFCPHVRSLGIASHDLSAKLRPVEAEQRIEGPFHGVQAQPTADGVRLLIRDCQYPGCSSGWLRFAGDAPAFDVDQHRRPGLFLDVRYRGTLLSYLEPGYAINGDELERPMGPPIRLSKRHAEAEYHSVLVDRTRKLALVVSVRDACDCEHGEQAILNHTVSRVELSAGIAEPVLHGNGAATALLDAGGGVYLQRFGSVQHWQSIAEIGKARGDPLRAELLLSAPRLEERNCCGL